MNFRIVCLIFYEVIQCWFLFNEYVQSVTGVLSFCDTHMCINHCKVYLNIETNGVYFYSSTNIVLYRQDL